VLHRRGVAVVRAVCREVMRCVQDRISSVATSGVLVKEAGHVAVVPNPAAFRYRGWPDWEAVGEGASWGVEWGVWFAGGRRRGFLLGQGS